MKKELLLSIIIFLLMQNASFSQCYPDRHSATWYDGWMSCTITTNPNTIRDKTHWIMYELDDIYYLYELDIWNMNAPDILDYGLKDVYIDISDDGTNWTEFGQFTFDQATGKNDFEGFEEFDFNGETAKYILITAINNYGGACYGLSEIRVRARKTCHSNIIVWIGDDGDWDVSSNWCGNQIPTDQDSVWLPPNKIINVPLGYIAEALWLDIDESTQLNVDGVLNVLGN